MKKKQAKKRLKQYFITFIRQQSDESGLLQKDSYANHNAWYHKIKSLLRDTHFSRRGHVYALVFSL